VFKRIIVLVIILNVVGWTIFVWCRHAATRVVSDKEMAQINYTANEFQGAGIMSAPDYTRMRLLLNHTELTQSISNDDLSYALRMMSSGSTDPSEARFQSIMVFDNVSKYEAGQKERIYKAALPLLHSDQPLDRKSGLVIIFHQRDNRAIPRILPLVTDPDPLISRDAKKFLAVFGYRIDVNLVWIA